MNINLYQLQNEYLQLTEQLMESGGELTPEIEQAIELNKHNLEVKGTNYGFIIKQLDSECEIIDSEMKRLKELKLQRERTIERLKTTLSCAMQLCEISELKTPLMKINFRKSESVDVQDIALLDSNFIKVVTTKTADKIAIKEAIKSGEVVQGAVLVTNLNLQVK